MEITLESIFQLFAESERQRIESAKEFHARIEAQKAVLEAQRIAIEAETANYEAQRIVIETEIAANKVIMEAERVKREAERIEESARREAERAEEIERRAISQKEYERSNRELNKQIADLGNALGMYAEMQVKQRIVEMFAERGIMLPALSEHYKQTDGKGTFLYELDLLLYDNTYAIAVEVKHHLKKDHIDEHLKRMNKCVISPPRGTEGKILLAAVATMIVSEEVEAYARKKGLYVIKPSGESVQIANPMNFKHKEWPTVR